MPGQEAARHCNHNRLEKKVLEVKMVNLAGGAAAGVGEGAAAAGAAAAAPPCLITRCTVIPSWSANVHHILILGSSCTLTLWEAKVSWSFIILPAKMRQRFSTGAPENLAEIASLN